LDEFLDFCREVATEPMITVNTGFGDAYSAAQQVEYCNASGETLGGSWRVDNGHAEPYGVRYWCVGNEMWGPWQLGFMQLQHYTLKHNQVAQAMWRVDRSLELVGSGQLGTINRQHDPNEKRTWSEGMLRECAGHMNFIAEHFYRGKNEDNLIAHVQQLADSVREKADGHRRLQAALGLLDDDPMPVAMTEWNYWYQPYVYGELGCSYDLADALGVAIGLHEYFRHSDLIHMAHYAQTVNVIGCIKTTKTAAFLDATALPLLLYRREFGTVPIEVRGDHGLLGMSVSAAWTEDRSAITIGIVNPNTDAKTIQLNVAGVELADAGPSWVIAGDDPAATNRADQQPLKIVERPFRRESRVHLPPLSITVVRLPAR
jgi:alpha-N-arabinofuranosidase